MIELKPGSYVLRDGQLLPNTEPPKAKLRKKKTVNAEKPGVEETHKPEDANNASDA